MCWKPGRRASARWRPVGVHVSARGWDTLLSLQWRSPSKGVSYASACRTGATTVLFALPLPLTLEVLATAVSSSGVMGAAPCSAPSMCVASSSEAAASSGCSVFAAEKPVHSSSSSLLPCVGASGSPSNASEGSNGTPSPSSSSLAVAAGSWSSLTYVKARVAKRTVRTRISAFDPARFKNATAAMSIP